MVLVDFVVIQDYPMVPVPHVLVYMDNVKQQIKQLLIYAIVIKVTLEIYVKHQLIYVYHLHVFTVNVY
jgi:hypothetical protein